VALLVGMAGGSHWSASIEPVSGAASLLFDLACRHSKGPKCLGSQYRRLSSNANLLEIRGDDAPIVLEGDAIAIEPASKAQSGTTRWKYVVSLNLEA
jgi:hypothetical protein